MVRRRLFAAALAVMLVASLLPAAALGSASSRIAEDLADGRLDGQYTREQLAAFARNATVQGYGDAVTQAAQPLAEAPLGEAAGEGVVEQEFLPFTGADLALMTAGGFLILALGLSMRRFARRPGEG